VPAQIEFVPTNVGAVFLTAVRQANRDMRGQLRHTCLPAGRD